MSVEYFLYLALAWLLVEGFIGFWRYRKSGRSRWAWWVMANTLSGAMLLLAAIAVSLSDGVVLPAMCLGGALIAHSLERKLRPDSPEQ